MKKTGEELHAENLEKVLSILESYKKEVMQRIKKRRKAIGLSRWSMPKKKQIDSVLESFEPLIKGEDYSEDMSNYSLIRHINELLEGNTNNVKVVIFDFVDYLAYKVLNQKESSLF